MSNTDVVLRHPVLEDGTAVFDLVDACKPLDLNSHYLYLLQCSHFAPTCVVATLHGEVVAWVSGYVTPNQTDTFLCGKSPWVKKPVALAWASDSLTGWSPNKTGSKNSHIHYAGQCGVMESFQITGPPLGQRFVFSRLVRQTVSFWRSTQH